MLVVVIGWILMTYKEELTLAMECLASDNRTIFLGQEAYSFYGTMGNVPKEKIIEMPVMEDAQLGIATGLSLVGFIPVCMYTRMDFFLLAFNQLINHLDKIEDMSHGDFKPRVVIRVAVGETKPLNPGPQHTQDFTDPLENLLNNIHVIKLINKKDIISSYCSALDYGMSFILVEYKDLYWS